MDTMTYRNYQGTVEYSAEDRVFHGKVMEIDDLIAYEGESEDELERDFRESVDEYIAFCAESRKTLG